MRDLDAIARSIQDAACAETIDRHRLLDLADEVREHAGYVMTDLDHRMLAHAKARGLVKLDDGATVTLVAWRPRKARQTARVRRSNGRSFSVPVVRVMELIE